MIEKLTGRGVFKVVLMSTKRLFLMIILSVVGCQQAGIAQNEPAVSGDTAAEAVLDTQLQVNRTALLEGKSEQMRVNAATVMLLSEDPLARKIVLNALRQSENSAARLAVCKALSQTRTTHKTIIKKQQFIQPLLEILTTRDFDEAKLAAQALLVFEYNQLSAQLERLVTDKSLPVKARLNLIYALKMQPDKRAAIKLIDLLDDPQTEVASAAEQALKALGILVGKDPQMRRQIRAELESKNMDEFLRYWLVRQDNKIRELQERENFWIKKYIGALEEIYKGISDDATRSKLLAENLTSPEAIMRLWALEKVEQQRIGTSELPAELKPILVKLISDPDRNVRLKTAKLLSLMGELNSAQKLLEQLKIEPDDEVKTSLFAALGVACTYASLPDSPTKISPETRKEALEWARKFLTEQNPKKAQKGAEVMRRLLEQNGLTPAEVEGYLGLLIERFNREKGKADGTLRGELLRTMAGLCAQGAQKTESARLFRPLFEEALSDKTALVREAAVDGLAYIDKTKALKKCRQVLRNDSSARIQAKLIELAGEVGGKEDLDWLWEKVGTADQGRLAWQAMLRIFKDSGLDVAGEWMAKFTASGKTRLSYDQMVSFLLTVERMAESENKIQMLREIREKLADLYVKNGKWEQAAKCLGSLLASAETEKQKESFLVELLNVQLSWGNLEGARQLIANRLLEGKLDPNDAMMRSIDSYLSKPSGVADPNALLAQLDKIEPPKGAEELWREQMKRWLAYRGHKDSGKSDGTGK